MYLCWVELSWAVARLLEKQGSLAERICGMTMMTTMMKCKRMQILTSWPNGENSCWVSSSGDRQPGNTVITYVVVIRRRRLPPHRPSLSPVPLPPSPHPSYTHACPGHQPADKSIRAVIAVVMTLWQQIRWLQLRFEFDSTAVRLLIGSY